MKAAPIERLLVALLGAAWVACAAATALTLWRDTGYPPLFVAAAPDGGAPRVTAARPARLGGDPGALRAGDTLLRLGDVELRGVGAAGFFVRFAALARDGAPVPVVYARAGDVGTTTVVPATLRVLRPLLAAAPVFAAVALILWLRGGDAPGPRAFAIALATVAFFLVANFGGRPVVTYTAMGVHVLTMTLAGPLILRALLLFPDRSRLTAAERAWPWLFAVLGLLHTGHVGAPMPPRPGTALAALVVVALLAACVAVVTRAWRRSDPVGRRRIKWVLLGVYGAALPPIATGVLSAVDPAYLDAYLVSLAAIACLPVALLIAIRRVNLFDIDRVLSVAASCNLLIGIAVALGVTVVPRAAAAAAALLGIAPDAGQLALSGLLGLAIFYAHQRLRPQIERLFFPERYGLDHGLHDVVSRVRAAPDLGALVAELGGTLCELVRPTACVVYARTDSTYVPLLAHTRVPPPVRAADEPPLAWLHGCMQPLAVRTAGAARHPDDVGARAALRLLDAEVVVPIAHGGAPALLLCLGAKRSGDVYTPTDLRLLATIGEAASLRLEHFAQAETIAHTRGVRDALRRYVPTALADALDTGRDLAPVEQDVTVLFVDLRGYTTLCERLAPGAVYELTSHYTAVVSAVLHRHGGHLVEFSGDGMMALFGAPQAVADKERAAVDAACELVFALHAHGPRGPDGAPLSAGIGIATGQALCGNIRSADQVIWSAVGDVVNLAARLQSLTRDIDASVVIDPRTRDAAAGAAAGFRRLDAVRLRGRSEPVVAYALPLGASA